MTTVKRLIDLTKYVTVLPYDSDIFGVYQSLLGWKSTRIQDRFREGFRRDRPALIDRLKHEFSGVVDVTYGDNNQVTIEMKPGLVDSGACVPSTVWFSNWSRPTFLHSRTMRPACGQP